MGFYNTFFLANASGQHCFDGAALANLSGGYQATDKQVTPDGVLITIRKGNNIIVDDLLLHFNGRQGLKDLTKDTVVLPVAKLATLPEDLQTIVFQHERINASRYRKDQ